MKISTVWRIIAGMIVLKTVFVGATDSDVTIGIGCLIMSRLHENNEDRDA